MISDDKKMAKRQRMVSKVQKMAVSSLPHSGGWSCARRHGRQPLAKMAAGDQSER